MTRLIDAEDLKKKLQYVYSCDYIDSKSKEGIASDIIDEIDNAPTVEVPENEDMNKEVAFFELSFADDVLGLKASNGYTIIRTGRSSAMTCYAIYDKNGKYVATSARLDDAKDIVRGNLSSITHFHSTGKIL